MKIHFGIILSLHLLYSVLCDSSENNNSAKCDSNTQNCEPFSLQRFQPNNLKVNTSSDGKILDDFNTIENEILFSDITNQENGNFYLKLCSRNVKLHGILTRTNLFSKIVT